MIATATASRAQLSYCIELGHQEWFTLQGQHPGITLHAEEDLTQVVSHYPGLPNGVALARLDVRRADQRIHEVIERCRRGEELVWWVGPASLPLDLPRRLRTAGFRCLHHLAGMSIELDRHEHAPRVIPEGVTIRQLDDFSVFAQHEHPFIGQINSPRRKNLLRYFQALCTQHADQVRAIVAMRNGMPIACALVFLGAQGAGIYDVGVLRQFRRRGIGTAIVLAALQYARDRGVPRALLQASSDGQRLYQRLGFSEVCRIGVWHFSTRP